MKSILALVTLLIFSTTTYSQNTSGSTPPEEESPLTEHCELEVPNAFSPNGDENNDLFYFSTDCNVAIEASIYNRWGNVVFEATDTSQGWDGNDANGEMVASGVYFYKCTVLYRAKDEVSFTGNVTLVR
jgi:gliding motility-associated-like protein